MEGKWSCDVKCVKKKKKINEERMENLESLLSKWGLGCGQVQFWMKPSFKAVWGQWFSNLAAQWMHVRCLEKHQCLSSSPRDSIYWMWGQSGKKTSKSMAPGNSNGQQGLSPPNSRYCRSEVLSTPLHPVPGPEFTTNLGTIGSWEYGSLRSAFPEGLWLSDPGAKCKTGSVLCDSWGPAAGWETC